MPPPLHALAVVLGCTFRSKPLVFFTGAWVAGILAADLWDLPPTTAVAVALGLIALALAAPRRALPVSLLLLAVAALGLGAARQALTPPRGDISSWEGRQVWVRGTVDIVPVQRCDVWRCFIRVEGVRHAGRDYPARGRLYVRTVQDLSGYGPGDRARVSGIPQRPSPARNPGAFSAALWLAQQGAFARLTARPGRVERLADGAGGWRRWPGRLRHHIARTNREAIRDPAAAALVNSLLFGDLDQDDPQQWSATEERFRRAGLSHVVVVSGAQVALLFGLPYGWRRLMLRPLGRLPESVRRRMRQLGAFSPRQAFASGLVLLLPYLMLVGFSAPVARAALVALIFLGARCLDRETDPDNSLAAAALLLLGLNPLALYDVGGQLSFAATWGILKAADLMSGGRRDDSSDSGSRLDTRALRLRWVPAPLKVVAAATLAAQLATAPLIAQHFQQFSVVAIVANLPVCLMAALLLPVGLASSVMSVPLTAMGPGAIDVAHTLSLPTEWLARGINGLVEWFARPEWALAPITPPGWIAVGIGGALLLAAATPAARRQRVSLGLALLGVGVVAAGSLWPAPPVRAPALTFIDVGQGDACLIRLPDGVTVLVDGGGSPRAPCRTGVCEEVRPGQLLPSLRTDCLDVGRDILAGYLRRERVRRIDLLVLTHPDDDHVWGLNAILDRRHGLPVGKVLDAGETGESVGYREWTALLRQRGLTPIRARRGMQLAVGQARLAVLHPPAQPLRGTRSDANNNSVVLRFDLPGTRVLLSGDTEAAAEAAMAGEDLRAEVLKVGHHGSATSTSEAWLARVRPRMAVISCGDRNPFGHPSPAVLTRLRQHGVQLYRTDRHGAVTLQYGARGWRATTTVPLARDLHGAHGVGTRAPGGWSQSETPVRVAQD